MLKSCLFILICFLYTTSTYAAGILEYNKWYQKNGVLFDVTQTSDNNPVMISIYAANKDNANMVVSYYSQGECNYSISTLKIDNQKYPVQYICTAQGKGKINNYTLSDAGVVNRVVERLRLGFTLLIEDDIKVWVENFNHPKYGIFPSN